jgi:branched-subunit amino acid aminotransferase/4-amino-4-deoxychorismate lyase
VSKQGTDQRLTAIGSDAGLLEVHSGIFETMRVENGIILHYAAHQRRMQAGLTYLGLDCDCALPVSREQTFEEVSGMFPGISTGSWRLKYAVSVRKNGHLSGIYTASPLPVRDSTSLFLSEHFQIDNTRPSHIKWLDRLAYEGFEKKAAAYGCEQAVISDALGNILETSRANLWVKTDGIWITPEERKGMLFGTAVHWICTWMRRQGIRFKVKNVTLGSFMNAEGLFLCNALYPCRPVKAIISEHETAYGPFAIPEWKSALETAFLEQD